MEDEIWVDIKGYEGLYQVSNKGRVKKIYKNGKIRILKTRLDNNGYLCVTLSKNNKPKIFKMHRLIATHFIPNPDNKPCVDHINTIRTDNRIENLRWVTKKENSNNILSKKNYSEARIGFKHSDETKEKLSKAHKGRPKSKESVDKMIKTKSIKVVQLTLEEELVKIWDSAIKAEREEGFNHRHIGECCIGIAKTHKKYKWMYYEDYIKLKGEI